MVLVWTLLPVPKGVTVQRHSKSNNYYEGMEQDELINCMAQILWYAQPNVNRSWRSVGHTVKEAYRVTARMFIAESKFRVSSTRTKLAREKWQAKKKLQEVSDPTGELIEFEEIDEDKVLGIKKR